MPTRKSRDVLLYWTDRVLRSPRRQLFALCLLVMVFISIGAALLTLIGSPGGWLANFWNAWSKVTGLDQLSGEAGTAMLLVNTALTLTQWFVFGFLVSMIGTAVSERLRAIRAGATHVLDRGHTVILGWNETVYSILDLLHSEDEGGTRSAVVVLSSAGKDAMEQQISKHCRSHRAHQTICRTGAIDSVLDLQRVNLPAARDVIIIGELAEEESAIDGYVLRAALACSQAVAGARVKPIVLVGHRLLHTGRLVTRLSGQWQMSTTTVHILSVLVKIIAQCAWQPGLAAVYRDLLSYGGEAIAPNVQPSNELYCIPAAKVAVPPGTTFEQAFWGLDRGTLVGYFRGTELVLNPLAEERQVSLSPDDRLVVVAAAREGVRYRPALPVTAPSTRAASIESSPRSVWLVGTGTEARAVLTDLVRYLPAGSRVAAAESPEAAPDHPIEISQINPGGLEFLAEETLRELVAGFDTIVISSDERSREQHDTSMLAQMSAIRSVCDDRLHQPIIVTELLDQRNWQLAANMDVGDILVTPELTSNYMVQLVKDPLRASVFRQLLGPDGAEIYVRQSESYMPEAREEVSWAELMAAAWARGEILIGYCQAPSAKPRGDGLILNPRGRDVQRPVGHYHRMVVLARD